MNRDPRLRGLSSEHHHALVLARTVRRAFAAGEYADGVGAAARTVFADELEPHFQIEEDILLPALAERGENSLVERTRADHARLRELVTATDPAGLTEFAALLDEHVRFEEREMFGACERILDDQTLAEVARRRPAPGRR